MCVLCPCAQGWGACMPQYTCRGRENIVELLLSLFFYVDFRDWMRVSRLEQQEHTPILKGGMLFGDQES